MFDVDVEEGAPPRKLATNRGENPYIAADRFIAQVRVVSCFQLLTVFMVANSG